MELIGMTRTSLESSGLAACFGTKESRLRKGFAEEIAKFHKTSTDQSLGIKSGVSRRTMEKHHWSLKSALKQSTIQPGAASSFDFPSVGSSEKPSDASYDSELDQGDDRRADDLYHRMKELIPTDKSLAEISRLDSQIERSSMQTFPDMISKISAWQNNSNEKDNIILKKIKRNVGFPTFISGILFYRAFAPPPPVAHSHLT